MNQSIAKYKTDASAWGYFFLNEHEIGISPTFVIPLWTWFSYLNRVYLVTEYAVPLEVMVKVMHITYSVPKQSLPYQSLGHLGCSVLLSSVAGTYAGKSKGAAGIGKLYCFLSGRNVLFHRMYSAM